MQGLWDTALEIRIAMQKLVTGANQLPRVGQETHFSGWILSDTSFDSPVQYKEHIFNHLMTGPIVSSSLLVL